MKTFAEEWERTAATARSVGMPEQNVEWCRRIFYCGAAIAFQMVRRTALAAVATDSKTEFEAELDAVEFLKEQEAHVQKVIMEVAENPDMPNRQKSDLEIEWEQAKAMGNNSRCPLHEIDSSGARRRCLRPVGHAGDCRFD